MAKAFRFRLEPVLKLRRHREDECKRTVALTLRGIADLRAEKAMIHEQIHAQVDRIRSGAQVGAVSPVDLSRHRYWLTHLQRAVLDIDGRVRTLEARLAQERAELAESARQRKVLTTLAERQRERFTKALARVERKEADEVATTMYLFGAQPAEML